MLNKIKKLFTRKNELLNNTYKLGSGISANYLPLTGGNSYGNGSKYESGMSSSRLVVLHNHQSIRQSARDMMYDSPECSAPVTSPVDNIVATPKSLKTDPHTQI